MGNFIEQVGDHTTYTHEGCRGLDKGEGTGRDLYLRRRRRSAPARLVLLAPCGDRATRSVPTPALSFRLKILVEVAGKKASATAGKRNGTKHEEFFFSTIGLKTWLLE
jgi:hypothetical protein